MYEMRTKHRLVTKWKQAHVKQADNEATADKAHAFFTLRATFKIWKGARILRQQQAFVEKRRLNDLKSWMDGKLLVLVVADISLAKRYHTELGGEGQG